MKTRMNVGSSPWGEDCAQIGRPGYDERAAAECAEFRAQLLRNAAEKGVVIPDGVSLATTPFPHDFGTYYEVTVSFDDDDKAQWDAVLFLVDKCPELWDEAARASLGLDVVPEPEDATKGTT